MVKLWRVYGWMDFLWMTRNPRHFFTYFTADAIFNVAAITGVLLLAERFDGIGAWTGPQVVFMLAYATTVTGAMETFFGYNVLHISRRLGRGQLDHTLVQPQPVWMALLTEGFTPFSGSSTLITGLGLLVWASWKVNAPVSAGWLAVLVVSLVASSLVVLAFSYLCGSLAFWAPRGAEEISSATVELLNQLKSFPLDGTGLFLQGWMLTVAPAGFIAWYPCRALLGLDQWRGSLAITPLAALAFWLAAAWLFRRGMDHYLRVGSQRYLDFGHRR